MPYKPYVVTDDLQLVIDELPESWRPSQNIQDNVSNIVMDSISECVGNVERICASRISNFITNNIAQTKIPVVSLMGAIKDIPGKSLSLEFSRSVKVIGTTGNKQDFQDIGLMPRRSDLPCVDTQIQNIAQSLKDSSPIIALADDVIFSGGTVLDIVEKLAAYNIAVVTIMASVALEKSIERLGNRNIKVIADYIYEDVIDEVCMRDFIIGAPGGGRNLLLSDGSYSSIPYVNPFGLTAEWASMDGKVAERHSQECIRASIILWSAIDQKRGISTKFGELNKPIIGCKPTETIVDKLSTYLVPQNRYAY